MSLFAKSKPVKKKAPRGFYEVLWDYVQSLGIALILALMIKTSVVEAYKIPSGSMERTLLVGDFLLANKFVYGMRLPIPFTDIRLPALAEPKPGDVVIFKYPKDPKVNYIKRCIAVAGQRIKIVNKQVFIDGQPLIMPPRGQFVDSLHIYPYSPQNLYPDGWGPGIRDNMPERVVPKGMMFMMGDNRDNSADSRYWGFLDRRLVQGKAMIIHWSWQPYNDDQNRKDRDANFPKPPSVSSTNPFSYVENIAFNIFHLPQRVRWTRIGRIIK